jgi:hypothetical protein
MSWRLTKECWNACDWRCPVAHTDLNIVPSKFASSNTTLSTFVTRALYGNFSSGETAFFINTHLDDLRD